jgi:hypothetical protein
MNYKLFFFLVTIELIVSSCKKNEFFKWNLKAAPLVEELVIKQNSVNSFEVSANFTSNGNEKNVEMGFCFSTSNPLPNVQEDKNILNGSELGERSIVKNWAVSGTIYCRAYIKNSLTTVYSNPITLVWSGSNINKPTVIIDFPSNVGFFGATCAAHITSNGGVTITNLGFQLCKTPSFTGPTFQEITSDLNLFDSPTIIDGLDNHSVYYIRGFATNLAGTGYSSSTWFLTSKFYEIGEPGPAGGVVFYNKLDDTGGWHFMECAPSDSPMGHVFATNSLTSIGGLQNEIGKGANNTALILNALGNINSAAKYSNNYSLNGFADWFLPSRDELIKIYQNYFNSTPLSFQGTEYWSSSEDPVYYQNAWVQKMIPNQVGTGSYTVIKNSSNLVRPVRCF